MAVGYFEVFYMARGTDSGKKLPTDSVNLLLNSLMEVCCQLLPLVQRELGESPDGILLVGNAQRVIAKVERYLQVQAAPVRQRSGYFGRVGNHYDFEITLFNVLQRQRFWRLEGRDRLGRRIAVRLEHDEDRIHVARGEVVYFRGKIKAHRFLFGEPVTYIEATSQVISLCS